MNIRQKVISLISREYTKMTADGIRTHACNETQTYRALKSRQFLFGRKTKTTRPPQSSVQSGEFTYCIYVNAFKPPNASFLSISAGLNNCGVQSVTRFWSTPLYGSDACCTRAKILVSSYWSCLPLTVCEISSLKVKFFPLLQCCHISELW